VKVVRERAHHLSAVIIIKLIKFRERAVTLASSLDPTHRNTIILSLSSLESLVTCARIPPAVGLGVFRAVKSLLELPESAPAEPTEKSATLETLDNVVSCARVPSVIEIRSLAMEPTITFSHFA